MKINNNRLGCLLGGGILLISLLVNIIFFRTCGFYVIPESLGFCKKNDIDRKDYWCIMGWQNCIQKMNYDADICFFGNSITYASDFNSFFPNKKIVNLGYPGDRIEGMIIRYKSISFVHPEKIFIMAGINDLSNSKTTIEKFCYDYRRLIDSILMSNPKASIYLESILPINHQMKPKLASVENILTANKEIENVAKEKGLIYIDLYSLYADDNNEMPREFVRDGIHLFPSSYKPWALAIKKYIDND